LVERVAAVEKLRSNPGFVGLAVVVVADSELEQLPTGSHDDLARTPTQAPVIDPYPGVSCEPTEAPVENQDLHVVAKRRGVRVGHHQDTLCWAVEGLF